MRKLTILFLVGVPCFALVALVLYAVTFDYRYRVAPIRRVPLPDEGLWEPREVRPVYLAPMLQDWVELPARPKQTSDTEESE